MNRKTHYQTLGLPSSCTLSQIQHSFHRLSDLHHPDKNPDDRLTSQLLFNRICQAFFTLSNPTLRSSYDQLLHKPDLDTAFSLLLRFFQKHGFQNQFQKDTFNQLYPDRDLTYYQILGIPVNASGMEVERAFRKLGLLYHPKTNAGDQVAEKKFAEICRAYDGLMDDERRKVYDDWLFGEIENGTALEYFNDYFKDKRGEFEEGVDGEFWKSWQKERIRELGKQRLRSPSEIHDYYKMLGVQGEARL